MVVVIIEEKYLLLLCIACLFVLFLYVFRKQLNVLAGIFSIVWLRVAFSMFAIYIVHIVAAQFAVQVVINAFAIACVVLLGIPGVFVVGLVSVIQSYPTLF